MSPKVLVLANSLANGGAERQLTLLVKFMPPEWERRVWSIDGGPYAEVLRDQGIHVYVCSRAWRFDIRPALNLIRVIHAWKPDVVHSFGYMSTLSAVIPCKVFNIPLVDGSIRQAVTYSYGYRSTLSAVISYKVLNKPLVDDTIQQANVIPKHGRIMRWATKFGDMCIANSQAGLNAFGISPSRGRVVYNSFDPDRLPLCTPLGLKKREHFTVIMVARMSPVKDYASFFAAAEQLANDEPAGWKFVAVGSGPDHDRLKTSSESLVRNGILYFSEPTLEVLPYVRQSDVGVLMTKPGLHAEGCSNAIMEYMACGLPVICSDSGGNRELVIDGVTGFIIAPEDVNGLVGRLRWLKNHPEEAQSMGEAGRQRIMNSFSVKRLVDDTLGVYNEVITRHKRPTS